MKNTARYIACFIAIVSLSVTIKPSPALSSPLTFNDYSVQENSSFTGPDPPFSLETPDLSDPAGSLVSGLISAFGINMTGDIYGPGISTWNNGTQFYNAGLTVKSSASAVGALATTLDIWNWYDPQRAVNTITWGVTYDLGGTSGETFEILLDYDFDYTNFNLALAGRSKSSTRAAIEAFSIPAAKVADHSANPSQIEPGPFLADVELYFEDNFRYSQEYNVVGGFQENSGEQSGQLNLGTMGSGDRLYLLGYLDAVTECENGFAGLTVATMFPSFTTTISAHEISDAPSPEPVPEPATVLLFGSGFVGLVWCKRKWKKV